MTKKFVYADIESNNAGLEYSMSPREFFRLGQFAINEGPVQITRDYDEFVAVIRDADYVVFHNGLSFDLRVLFGVDSLEPLKMALAGKVIDTFVLGSLLTPAPYSYTNSKGHTFYGASKPEQAMKWLSLENQCFQFGLPGKFGDLAEIAKRYNPEKTPRKELDFGLIDLDDQEFNEYAEQDVIAVRGLYHYYVDQIEKQNYSSSYIWREMVIWAITAQITSNGVSVDIPEAQDRVAELALERDSIMEWLVGKFGFPTKGKQPWKSAAGKEAILAALADYGITPKHPDWVKTANGAPSFGGEVLKSITADTEAQKLGESLALLMGQRSLAQLALDSVKEDGKAHPDIMCLQRSGRTSVTRPGLTVWTARGPGAVEKRYFTADEGQVMVEADFSAADARAVAAVSGDAAFAKRFEPGVDSHDLTGEIFFGHDEYYANRAELRPKSKGGGHALAYRVGARKLAETVGVDYATGLKFLENYQKAYPLVARWQNKITQFGESNGYVENAWGRRMTVDEGRSFTQSSALIGQSTTREMLFDGLIRIAQDNVEAIRSVRMIVHDAIVFSVPNDRVQERVDWLMDRMQATFDPKTPVSLPTYFPMEYGPLDQFNWYSCSHG